MLRLGSTRGCGFNVTSFYVTADSHLRGGGGGVSMRWGDVIRFLSSRYGLLKGTGGFCRVLVRQFVQYDLMAGLLGASWLVFMRGEAVECHELRSMSVH